MRPLDGRAARVARSCGARRTALDRAVALVARFPTDSHDGRTLVESVPGGWWYTSANGQQSRRPVQTPGVSQVFGCTPLGPAGWAIAGCATAAAMTASVAAPAVWRLARRPSPPTGVERLRDE